MLRYGIPNIWVSKSLLVNINVNGKKVMVDLVAVNSLKIIKKCMTACMNTNTIQSVAKY